MPKSSKESSPEPPVSSEPPPVSPEELTGCCASGGVSTDGSEPVEPLPEEELEPVVLFDEEPFPLPVFEFDGTEFGSGVVTLAVGTLVAAAVAVGDGDGDAMEACAELQ